MPRSHSASLISVNSRSGASTPVWTIPALLTSTSKGPCAATRSASSHEREVGDDAARADLPRPLVDALGGGR